MMNGLHFLILAKIVLRYIILTRQYHREATAFPQLALDVQCPVMSHNKIAGDGKAPVRFLEP